MLCAAGSPSRCRCHHVRDDGRDIKIAVPGDDLRRRHPESAPADFTTPFRHPAQIGTIVRRASTNRATPPLRPSWVKSPGFASPPHPARRRDAAPGRDAGPGSSLMTRPASLAAVIGLLLLAVWLLRRWLPGGARRRRPPTSSKCSAVRRWRGGSRCTCCGRGRRIPVCLRDVRVAETLTEVTDLAERHRRTPCAVPHPSTRRRASTGVRAVPAAARGCAPDDEPAAGYEQSAALETHHV